MAMNVIEKILARKCGQKQVRPGELISVDVDTVVMFDNNFMYNIWQEILKVQDPRKIVVVFDHRVPAPHIQSALAQKTGRDFARKFGIERFHDVGPKQGISHQLVVENAYALPGTVLVCSDSHTCSGGVLNCAARGIGGADITYSACMGTTWFRLGETIRYDLTGVLHKAVSMKDVFFHVAGRYGDHATVNVEYGGPALPGLSISARKTLTTMSAELSADFAVFEPDRVMLDYVRSRTSQPFEEQYADDGAAYAERRTIDLGAIEPLVALPDTVLNNSRSVGEVAGTRIDQAFIGSCANGTIEDLESAAQILAGRQVADSVRLMVTPASQAVYREAMRRGIVSTLMDAGAVVTPATCGACGGGHMGVLAPGEVCITASTRNFKGRMGDPSAKIYMGSPATVAASAIRGAIADPREFLN
jgi:3-isopropylmalate/(R)-2-methylmalate dehydratase large subunit